VKPCFVKLERLNLDAYYISSGVSSCFKKIALQAKSASRKKSKQNNKPKPICVFCDKSFSVFYTLLTHVRNIHGHYPYCRKCEKFFTSELALKEHSTFCSAASKANKKSVPVSVNIGHCCKLCNKTFDVEEQLKLHTQTEHPEVLRQTVKHPKIKQTKQMYNEKERIQRSKILSYISSSLLDLELQCGEQKLLIHCMACKRDLTIIDYFKSHVEQFPNNNKQKQCDCPFCGFVSWKYLETPLEFLIHIKNHCTEHLDVMYCNICKVAVPNRYNEILHMFQIHTKASNLTIQFKGGLKPNETAAIPECQVVGSDVELVPSPTVAEVPEDGLDPVQTCSDDTEGGETEGNQGEERGEDDTGSDGDSTEYYMEFCNGENGDAHPASPIGHTIPVIDLDNDDSDVELPKVRCPEPACNDTESHEREHMPINEKDSSNDSQETVEAPCSSSISEEKNTQNTVEHLKVAQQESMIQADKDMSAEDSFQATREDIPFVVHCTVCYQDIKDKEYFEDHYQECFVDKEIQCPLCGLEILRDEKDMLMFFTHIEKHFCSGMRTVECNICDQSFFNLFNQTIHEGNVHSSNSSINLKAVLEKPHSDIYANPVASTSKFTENAPLPPRLRSGNKIKFDIALRDLLGVSESQLKANDSTKNYSIFCMTCSKDVPYSKYFGSHLKECSNERNYVCVFCGMKMVARDKYPFHYVRHVQEHLAKPFFQYNCECGLVFIDHYNGILHTSTMNHLYRPANEQVSGSSKAKQSTA
jgi:hypothetical protein